MSEVAVKRRVVARSELNKPAIRPLSRPASPVKSRPNSPLKTSQTPQYTPSTTPTNRPRAKISSSAKINVGKKPANLAPPFNGTPNRLGDAAVMSRSPSPSKMMGSASQGLSSLTKLRAKVNVIGPSSSPNSPRLQPHSLVASPTSSEGSLSTYRKRQASISSMSQVSSLSSAKAPSTTSTAPGPESTTSDVSPFRVRAKVNGFASNKSSSTSSTSQTTAPTISSPPSSSPLSQPPRMTRATSASSLTPRDPPFYPITTASPVANVHRFATVRSPPSSISHQRRISAATALQSDPTLVPLPPSSPPSSNVSFSSRSSVSVGSSQVSTPAPSINLNGAVALNNSEHRLRSNSILVEEETESQKRVKAEAKINRKIADLEISNQSLLSVNATLESFKIKQAKEIRDLKRRLRETSLSLPPRRFREMRSSGAGDEFGFSDDEDDDDDDEDPDDLEHESANDVGFRRVRTLIETLLEEGRKALEKTTEDFRPSGGGARVLSEEEARSWRDGYGRRSGALNFDEASATDNFDESYVTAHSDNEAEVVMLHRKSSTSSCRSEEEVEHIVDGSIAFCNPALVS